MGKKECREAGQAVCEVVEVLVKKGEGSHRKGKADVTSRRRR